jgi:hypothetical protein
MRDSSTRSGAVRSRPSAARWAFVLCALASGACGSGNGRPPPAPAEDGLNNPGDLSNYDSTTADSRDNVAAGECETGTTQDCRVYLPAHDGIQPCFVGVQSCVEEHWGDCEDAVLVDANAGDATLGETPAP